MWALDGYCGFDPAVGGFRCCDLNSVPVDHDLMVEGSWAWGIVRLAPRRWLGHSYNQLSKDSPAEPGALELEPLEGENGYLKALRDLPMMLGSSAYRLDSHCRGWRGIL